MNTLQVRVREGGGARIVAGEGSEVGDASNGGDDQAPEGNTMMAKLYGALKSNLGMINMRLGAKLKDKDPMTLDVHKEGVEFNHFSGLSSLHLQSFEVKSMNLPDVAFGVSADLGAPLKIDGAASAMESPLPISIELQQVSFKSDKIVAHLDPDSGLIQKFDVAGAELHFGSVHVSIQMKMKFIRDIIEKKVSAKLQEKHAEISEKIGGKINAALDKVLNEKMKDKLNKKIKEQGS